MTSTSLFESDIWFELGTYRKPPPPAINPMLERLGQRLFTHNAEPPKGSLTRRKWVRLFIGRANMRRIC